MKSERRVRVADWLGSLVDQGGPKAMLAMNGALCAHDQVQSVSAVCSGPRAQFMAI